MVWTVGDRMFMFVGSRICLVNLRHVVSMADAAFKNARRFLSKKIARGRCGDSSETVVVVTRRKCFLFNPLLSGAEACVVCTMTYCDVRCNEDCSSFTSRSGIFVMSHGGNHFVPAC